MMDNAKNLHRSIIILIGLQTSASLAGRKHQLSTCSVQVLISYATRHTGLTLLGDKRRVSVRRIKVSVAELKCVSHIEIRARSVLTFTTKKRRKNGDAETEEFGDFCAHVSSGAGPEGLSP